MRPPLVSFPILCYELLTQHTRDSEHTQRLSVGAMLLAIALGASVYPVRSGTVQDWEQGRRKPSGPAVALLRIAEQKPEVFVELS